MKSNTNILILVALEEELDQSLVDFPIFYTGVGLCNAAIHATVAIQQYEPQIVVNYGSAGSISDVSGLVSVASVCQRDANCEPLRPRGFMLKENMLYLNSGQPGIRCGSGNGFVTKPDKWTKRHCDIVDMELWSIAKACAHFNVPWISMKWISDQANSKAGDDWHHNAPNGQELFCQWLKKFSNDGNLISGFVR